MRIGIGKLACGFGIIVMGLFGAAHAGTYPIDGRWTYDGAEAAGPAQDCGVTRHIDFIGERRLDTGTSAPDYRNLSIVKSGSSLYRVIDEFFTGPIHGKLYYTLRLIDPDHIEMRIETNGKTLALRRCES